MEKGVNEKHCVLFLSVTTHHYNYFAHHFRVGHSGAEDQTADAAEAVDSHTAHHFR